MGEKTTTTIDFGIVIAEGQEKVFENQHIRLEAGIECNGRLIFKNCTLESCANLESRSGKKGGRKPLCRPGCISMGIDGKLEMDGCEIIHPGQEFISGWNITIKNTSFLIPSCADSAITVLSVTPCIISTHGVARFEDCSFVEEVESDSSAPVLNLVSYNKAEMDKCTFKSITGKIETAMITNCTFTDCANIESEKISGSTFTDCGHIAVDAENGYIRNCDFTRVKAVFATLSDIDSCKFRKLKGDVEDDGIILLEDCKITHCSFDDVELRNGSYLIDGVGDACVEYCQFANCRTDQNDGEICRGKIETGKRGKRWIEVDILRDDTCTGLNTIEKLG